MKYVRKSLALLLALLLVLALGGTAFAEGNSITVKNAVKDQTYELYKMLDLKVDDKLTAYSYTVNSDWADFFKADDPATTETNEAGKGLTYVNIDAQGYVTWKENADVAAFAKDAEEFAKNLDALQTYTATADGDFTFSNLEAGYYLVTSTLGTKATVGTTPGTPNPEIQEKNEAPTNVKTVEEDSTHVYGEKNDADIGQTVNFKSTITAQAGAENYVFHDKMSAGLNYTGVTGITLNDGTVDASNYTVVTTGLTDGCTFEVRFTQAFCDTLKANDQIVVSYTATLNENAVVGLPGNPNESKLSYGDKGDESHTPSGTTPPSETTTYTWDMDVLKYANGDESKVLKDAEFVLLNSAKDKVATVVNGKLTGWVAVPAAVDGTITWPANTVLTTDANGKIAIDGLDADTYYLREVKAPAGYNKQKEDTKVEITGATTVEGKLTYSTVVAKVNNQTGTELPSTGGMGTTLFYVLGSVLVVGAVVLLVTRKRMSNKG